MRNALVRVSLALWPRIHARATWGTRPENPFPQQKLTTICAHLYNGSDVLTAASRFAEYVCNRLATVVSGEPLPIDNILDFHRGKWRIMNPADDNENFADRWENDLGLAEAFFAWAYQLRRDLHAFVESHQARDLALEAPGITDGGRTFGERLYQGMTNGPVENSTSFLNLIHQGIEGKVSWDRVREVAVQNVDQKTDGLYKDVAWINYYQVLIHSGAGLSAENRTHIRSILDSHSESADFVFCCNLLLGSSTEDMLEACICDQLVGHDVLAWPITKLAKGQIADRGGMIIPALS